MLAAVTTASNSLNDNLVWNFGHNIGKKEKAITRCCLWNPDNANVSAPRVEQVEPNQFHDFPGENGW